MGRSRLVIGLDYGTTYTGVSFCEVSDSRSDRQHIEVIHDWSARHGKIGTREKVPSEVAYLDEGLRWGCDIPPHEKRHMWTKFELDNRAGGEAAKIIGEMTTPSQTRKPPVEIIADFLAQVKEHLIKNLDDKYDKELWRTLSIMSAVTAPAVWSDVAKHRTMQAIEKVGFNSLKLKQLKMSIVVTIEPEAAALYTIKTLSGTAQDANLAVGDGPTVVEEATISSSAQCGGSFVDRAISHLLERRLGTPDFVKIAGCRSEEIPLTSLTRKAAKLLQDFNVEVKSGFSGTQTNYLLLPNPLSAIEDDKKRGISDGELKITSDDTQAMFALCLCQTYELIQEQIQRARVRNLKIKYVFLVGGFSGSPYMFAKIRDYLEKQDIHIIRPSNSWSAIVRGAATKGLEQGSSAVSKRKSRQYYGTSYSEPFHKRYHHKDEMFIDKFYGQDLLTLEAKHAAANITSRWWVGEALTYSWKLLACDADITPSRSVENSVYRVTTLTVDLSDLSERNMELATNSSGRHYYMVDCEINISLQSSLEFYLTAKSKKFGSVTVTYD